MLSISVIVILFFFLLSLLGVYNGPDRTGLAVDSQTGPNIATCCCVNGRGLSMFDLRMPLPMDFIYDVSFFFILVAASCTLMYLVVHSHARPTLPTCLDVYVLAICTWEL